MIYISPFYVHLQGSLTTLYGVMAHVCHIDDKEGFKMLVDKDL